jgi:NAD(P)-dependent dehydrogenase (short-subunit alcohol dehydrogenase family)
MSGVTLALVSGANRGIGLEVARELARDGHRVLAGTRSLEAMGELQGLDLTPLQLDVSDPDSVEQVVGAIAVAGGELDVLVNNAGVYPPGRASRIDFDVVEETWRINALGAWRLAVAAIPSMGPGARIVNVSSGAGSLETMDASMPAYNVSKAALNAITRVLAADLRSDGILVNSVCPGWVRTDMGGAGASRSVQDGAASVLWAARLGSDGPTGGFFRDGRPVPW